MQADEQLDLREGLFRPCGHQNGCLRGRTHILLKDEGLSSLRGGPKPEGQGGKAAREDLATEKRDRWPQTSGTRKCGAIRGGNIEELEGAV